MNMSNKFVTVMVAGVSLLGLGATASADGNGGVDAVVVSQLPISQDQAVNIARQSVPGTVLGTEFDQKNEAMLWEIEIIDGTGQAVDIEVDATTGEILTSQATDADDKDGNDDDDDDDDGNENDRESSEGRNDQDQK